MSSMTVQSAIQLHLSREGPCTLESLLTRLSEFSWSEIFSVVDQLSREGSLVLRRPARFGYEVSISSPQVMSESAPSGTTLACNRSGRMDDCTAF
jgi:hypothetical protein